MLAAAGLQRAHRRDIAAKPNIPHSELRIPHFTMSANEYVFRDEWLLPAPIERVWPWIVNGPAYPEWWSQVYERVTPLNDLPPDRVGSRMEILAHGRLPYKIRFVGEVTRVEAPHCLGLTATGDLSGTGLWTLRADSAGTAVTFDWIVRADKPVVRIFSRILKPLFAWNHRWAMRIGEAALKEQFAGLQTASA